MRPATVALNQKILDRGLAQTELCGPLDHRAVEDHAGKQGGAAVFAASIRQRVADQRWHDDVTFGQDFIGVQAQPLGQGAKTLRPPTFGKLPFDLVPGGVRGRLDLGDGKGLQARLNLTGAEKGHSHKSGGQNRAKELYCQKPILCDLSHQNASGWAARAM